MNYLLRVISNSKGWTYHGLHLRTLHLADRPSLIQSEEGGKVAFGKGNKEERKRREGAREGTREEEREGTREGTTEEGREETREEAKKEGKKEGSKGIIGKQREEGARESDKEVTSIQARKEAIKEELKRKYLGAKFPYLSPLKRYSIVRKLYDGKKPEEEEEENEAKEEKGRGRGRGRRSLKKNWKELPSYRLSYPLASYALPNSWSLLDSQERMVPSAFSLDTFLFSSLLSSLLSSPLLSSPLLSSCLLYCHPCFSFHTLTFKRDSDTSKREKKRKSDSRRRQRPFLQKEPQSNSTPRSFLVT